MKRREMIMLSGAALAAHEAVAQTKTAASTGGMASSRAAKTLLKYSHAKSSYHIPKNGDKTAKYVGSLSVALSLTPDQQQAASTIFLSAVTVRAGASPQIKAARKNLSDAVLTSDNGAIGQASAAIANLRTQLINTGAQAHSAFYHILTTDQQAKLLQFRS
jgi:hypothetical protein